jgi:hypothetical protein
MAAIEGSVTIGGFIAPSDTTDTYPSHVDIYGRGGMRSVADNTERDAITSDRRSEGMFVYVLDPAGDGTVDATLYTLSGGITNSNWIEVELGGGGYWQQVNASTSIYFVPGSGDGRVGIGTNSPSYDLHVSKDSPAGTVYIGVENTSNIGTVGAGTYYIADTQTWSNVARVGSYKIVNDTDNVTPFEIEKLAPNASIVVGQNGVGIGKTAATNVKLDVDGNIRFASDGAGANYLEFVRNSSNNWKLGSSGVGEIFSQVGNASNWKQDFTATRRYIKSAPTTEQFSNGVGYPAIWGQQTWTDAAYRHRHLFLDVTDSSGGTTGSTIIEVQKNGTVGFVVDKDFNVGIGTSSPEEKLHVTPSVLVGSKGFSTPAAGQLRVASPNASYGELGFTSQYDNFPSGIRSYGLSSNYDRDLRFYTKDTASATDGLERMRITEGGNVGIGTATPEEKLHVAGNIKLDGTINSANLTPTDRYDIRNWTYTGKRTLDNSTFNPIQLLGTPRGLFFKDDGTKMYISDDGNDAIYEYNLSIAWDIETAVQSYKLSTVTNPPSANVPYSIFFSSDGTVLFLADNDEKTVQVWDLSIAWDLSTASSNDSKKLVVTSLVTEVTNMSSLFFNPDGNIMLVYDFNTEKIYRFDLSTAWDPSTATHTSSTLNMSSAADYPGLPTLNSASPQNYFGIWVLDDGLTMYTSEYQTDTFIQWSMSTAWDITTLSIVRYTSTPRGNDILVPTQFYFADSIKKLFVLDDYSDSVFEFDTSAGVNIRSLSSDGKVFSEKGEFNGLIVNGILDVRGGTDTQGLTAQSSGINTTGGITANGSLQTGRSTGSKSAYINYYGSKADPNDTQTYRTQSYAGINIRHHNESYDQVDIGSYSNSYINIVGEVDNIGSTDITGQIRVQNKKTLRESIAPSGTIVHRDTFTESFDTDITVHTPDVGSAYTIQNTDGADATAVVSGGNGYATTSPSPNDNEGITVLCNTTLPTDYVAKWEFSSSSSLPPGDSYVFTILLNYKDNDNFDILRLSRDADDTILYVRRAGVITYGHIQTEIKNIGGERGDYTTTYNTDTLNIDLWGWAGNKNPASLTLEARKVGDYLVLIYDGIIGYVAEVDWFASHKIGFGWGANSLTNSNDEAHDSWKLDSFTVQEITDRDLDSVSYIENGNFGIGTTSPTANLHSMAPDGNTFSLKLGRADNGSEWSFNHAGDDLRIYNQGGSGKDILFSVDAGGTEKGNKVGIGTATPSEKLHVSGKIKVIYGTENVLIGDAGNNITGYSNTALGSLTLRDATAANQNVAIGQQAQRYTTGNYNVTVGTQANMYTTGGNNVALGGLAAKGDASSTFTNTTAVGYRALTALTTGEGNTAVGVESLRDTTTGIRNTVVGNSAGAAVNAGYNAIYGYQAGQLFGNNNTAMGYVAGKYNSGENNVLIGAEAGEGASGSSSFSNTVAVGYQALTALTTGTGNTAVGYLALANATTNLRNTAVGYGAFDEIDGTNNVSYSTGLGYGVSSGGYDEVIVIGHNVSAGGHNSVSIGGTAGYQGVAIGDLAKNGRGISIGYGAGRLIQGSNDHNIFIGNQSGYNTNGASRNTFLGQFTGLNLSGGDNNTLIGYNAGYNIANGSSNIFLGYNAGYNETGSNKLYIANSDTTTPLIYGEFDNEIVRVNGSLNSRLTGQSYDSLQVGEVFRFKPLDGASTVPSSNAASVYISRDGSTSTDVVALNVGDKIKIKRNGGGTPTFNVGNGAFIYEQSYDGNAVTNTNPFNNGAGMGIRNTSQGSPVILALLINGTFGALNSAGSTLNIGNPNGMNNNWAQDQQVYFQNTSLFGVRNGNTSNFGNADGWVIRSQSLNTDSVSDYRHGLQLSNPPNLGVSSNGGKVYTTNGSNVLDANTLGYSIRSFVEVGDTIYVCDASTNTHFVTTNTIYKHTVTAVDLVNNTITIDSNYAGTTGTSSAYLEKNIVTVRNYNGDVMTRVKGTGEFQIGSDAAGYLLPSTDGTSGQVLSTNGSGTVTWATVSGGGTDTNLGSNDLTSTATTRKFTLYSDNSTLGIFRSGGTNPIAYFTQGGASGANAVSVYGELNVYEDTSGNAELRLRDSSNNYAAIQASASTTSYTITLPSSGPGAGSKILESDASGNLSWINTPTGGGVNVSGTPVNNQLAVWTNSTDIEGDGNLTWSGTELLVQGQLRADVIEINGRANASSQPAGTIGAGSKVMTQAHTTGTVTAGTVYVLGSSAWTASDADAGSTSTGLLAVATDAASPSEMLLEGSVTMSSNTGFSAAAKGDVLYLSLTTGELTSDISGHTTGDFVRVCGYVIDASKSEVFFSPSRDWIEL